MTIKGENIKYAVDDLNFYIKHKSKVEEITDLLEYAKGFVYASYTEDLSNKEARIKGYSQDALDTKEILSAEELVAILPVRLKHHTNMANLAVKRLYDQNGICLDFNERVKSFSFKESLEKADKRDEESENQQAEIKKSNKESMRALREAKVS